MALGASVLTIASVFAVRANKKFAGILTVYYNNAGTYSFGWQASSTANNAMVTTSNALHGYAHFQSSTGTVTLVTKTNHTPLYSKF